MSGETLSRPMREAPSIAIAVENPTDFHIQISHTDVNRIEQSEEIIGPLHSLEFSVNHGDRIRIVGIGSMVYKKLEAEE